MHRLFRHIDWFAVGTGMLFLFTAAWIPIWRCWNLSSWEAFGGLTSLWRAAERMGEGNPYVETVPWLFVWHQDNWILAIGIFLFGFLFAWGTRRLQLRSK